MSNDKAPGQSSDKEKAEGNCIRDIESHPVWTWHETQEEGGREARLLARVPEGNTEAVPGRRGLGEAASFLLTARSSCCLQET